MKSLRRFNRCSRADVLWSLALFLTGQLAMALAIESWLPELRDPRYACRAAQLIPRANSAKRPLTIVVLGSSHVQDGFNASELETRLSRQFARPLVLFNFGIPAAGPVANLLHFDRLLAAGVKPDLLIVEVAPILMGGSGGALQEAGYFTADRLWRGEVNLVERYGLPGTQMRHDWWQDWFVPCHAHRAAIASRLLPEMLPPWSRLDGDRQVDASGWRLRNPQPLTAAERAWAVERAWNDFGSRLQTFEICAAACRAQRDLLARCRAERVAVALIWMPESKHFQSWYPPAVERRIRDQLEKLTEEFDVPLINARDWVADADDFLDGHHLRHVGGSRFTERLGEEVLAPLFGAERGRWVAHLAELRRSTARPVARVASRRDISNVEGTLLR